MLGAKIQSETPTGWHPLLPSMLEPNDYSIQNELLTATAGSSVPSAIRSIVQALAGEIDLYYTTSYGIII